MINTKACSKSGYILNLLEKKKKLIYKIIGFKPRMNKPRLQNVTHEVVSINYTDVKYIL